MKNEIRFAARSLVKTPGFTAVALLILALGIGAVTAVFSAVEAVILHPLPFRNATELNCVLSAAQNEVGLFSIPVYCDYRDQNRSFQGLAAVTTLNTNLVDQGEAQLVQGLRVSAGAFDLIGSRPGAGRARPEQILYLVLREGFVLVALGAGVGVAAALALSQFIAAQLYDVSPQDPAALALSVLLVFGIAFVACWLPACRAAKVDPMVALQAD